MLPCIRRGLAALGVAGAAVAALAEPVEVRYPAPSLDRWMYPFNSTPGTRPTASTFGAIRMAGFDDRDGQFLVGYNTGAAIPAGLGAGAYRVVALRLAATIAVDRAFAYDPTVDPLGTYLEPGTLGAEPDGDTGRPIEVFPVGFRNGWTLASFQETSPFGGQPLIPPAERARNVFAARLDEFGAATDASRNVRLVQEAPSIAVGVTAAVGAGELVPLDTEFTFEVNVLSPGLRRYLAESLNTGRILLAVSSLQPLPGPGGPVEYPVFYTKENPLALPPFNHTARMELAVILNCDTDLDGDRQRTIFDFLLFQNLWDAQDPIADYEPDGSFDIFDFLSFQNAFASGGC